MKILSVTKSGPLLVTPMGNRLNSIASDVAYIKGRMEGEK